MKLSVIIPTCNRNDLLQKCLDLLSPINQTIETEKYEVIVTDDSKNNLAQLLSTNYPWVKFIQGPKQGPAANRNNGANHAIGEWFVFIDDDCLPDKNLLKEYWIEIKKGVYDALEGAIEEERPQKRFDEIAPINTTGGKFWSCNIALKKELFIRIGGFDQNFTYPAMEDIDLYNRVKEITKVNFIRNAFVIHPWRLQKNPVEMVKQKMVTYQYFCSKHPYYFKKVSFCENIKNELRFYIKFVLFNLIPFRGKGVIPYIKAHIVGKKYSKIEIDKSLDNTENWTRFYK